MADLLLDRITDPSPINFNTPSFRHALVMNNARLTRPENVLAFRVEPTIAHKYKGDFFGLLKHLRIDDQYHWFIAYVNGIEDSQMFDGLKTDITIVDNRPIDDFSSAFRTTAG